MVRNEAKTRRELIEPKLRQAGWGEHDWQIEDEYRITDGRISFDGKEGRRSSPVYVDYLLRYRRSRAIAVVEAKAEDKHHCEGERQAKDYATRLGLWYAYATNGHEIEFYNLKDNTQQTVANFHSPQELWHMYLQGAGFSEAHEKEQVLTQDYYDESKIGQRRKLRYYQEKAINNALEAILTGQKRVLITMATGTGKTFTAMQLVYKLWKTRYIKRVLFIVDRNILADQAFSNFDNAMDSNACYRLLPKDKEFPQGRDLYFSIYQTLVGIDEDDATKTVTRPDRFKEFAPDYFDLIIIDEAHRGARQSKDGRDASAWFKLLEYFKSAIQVGLTATPKRDETNDTYACFGAPVISYSLKDGIQDGYLAPYVIKRVTSNIDALGYRPDSPHIQDVRGQALEVKDYLTPDFERQLSIPQRTRAFAFHLLRHLFATDPLGKTIVFCLNQEHALDMAKYCREAFILYKDKYELGYDGNYAVRITGADKDNSGKYPDLEKFQDLSSHQPIIVTTSKLLTTGIDVKSVKNIVIFRNIGSMVEFKQIIGRGTRVYEVPSKSNSKLGFHILEYANHSTQLFDDPEWDDEAQELVDEGAIEVEEDKQDDVEEIPVAQAEKNSEAITGDGIYDEPDADKRDDIRYRMSENFLRGQVDIAAEASRLTGADGKPVDTEQFVIFQANILKKHYPNAAAFSKMWQDLAERKNFQRDLAMGMGIDIAALTNIFFERHKARDVDTYDVLACLLFNTEHLTKGRRIAVARSLQPAAFDLGDEDKNSLVHDMLAVYKEAGHASLSFDREFWQLPVMRKHGGFDGAKKTFGSVATLQAAIVKLQRALYDERIVEQAKHA